MPHFECGSWWLAYRGVEAVAFAGVVPSTHARNSGYFCRVGVVPKHRGHGLQRRLMRAVEAQARRNGWNSVVSDTTDNRASANNFIAAGYRLYQPESPWGWSTTLYWRKWIRRV
jgi:GNAT superfamily N-acetyltransferase